MSYTSRLLNYVEPYYIDGTAKTAVWTEVNTNLQRNDKVFIINGHYDSELFIRKGKWVKNADGYRVLAVDRCRVVLDIDWEAGQFAGLTQTYREDDFDNFIKVHNVRSQREFDYLNKVFVDSYTQSRVSKFEYGLTNNIIYSDFAWTGATGLGRNDGLSSAGLFWSRSGFGWVDITTSVRGNSMSFGATYAAAGLTNNSRLLVMGEDITYAGNTLRERNVYKWVGTASWAVDKLYKRPIVSKLYFKEGVFMGTHNDGVFGSYEKAGVWTGTPSVWNSGFLVNSDWESGVMSSKSSANEQSHYSALVGGVPVQTTDFSNNRGNGYNYMLDSNLKSGVIENGNAINCNVGTYSTGLTALDAYFGTTNSYPLVTQGGLYEFCDVANARLEDSTTLDSVVMNSHLVNTRALNSQLKETLSVGGQFSANDAAIKVLSADLQGYIPGATAATHSSIRAALKLYIGDEDLLRLETFDSFYLTRVNREYILSGLDSDLRVWLPVETKYVLDTFYDFKLSGAAQECLTTTKTRRDNKNTTVVEYDGLVYRTRSSANPGAMASIDVDLSGYLAFYLQGGEYRYVNQAYITKPVVADLFRGTSITNSDFRDGVAKSVLWRSGSHLNYPSNIVKWDGARLSIAKVGADTLLVTLSATQSTVADNLLRNGSYVWLDSVEHLGSTGGRTDVSGVYTVATYSQDSLYLRGPSASGISYTGTFSAAGGHRPSYLSVHKLLVEDSTVANGLFIRNLFRRSVFEDDLFDTADSALTNENIQRLRVINNYVRGGAAGNSTVRSGLFHNSHLLGVAWESGISDNSVWDGPAFGSGVFNNGFWVDGTFSGGRFQNSRGTTFSSDDYTGDRTYLRGWRRGTFNSGDFYNSVWLEGTFNLGKMWSSDWYGGVWNNGVLGDANTPTSNTTMAKYLGIGTGATQTVWYNGVVENAEVGGQGHMTWQAGSFNGGVFSASASTATARSLWVSGQFNGGDFTGMAKWLDGTFNGGRFRSHYGWTMSASTQSSDYSWEAGLFAGGEFGLANGGTNSTWWGGFMEGGTFRGRVWNSGIMTGGTFEGSGTQSAAGSPGPFSQGFTQSYWGLWRSGTVTDAKHKADATIPVEENRLAYDQRPNQLRATVRDALWLNGVFDHPGGSVVNSVWLDGRFRKGRFSDGSFNPYVRRDWWSSGFGTQSAFNFDLASCVWENGSFDGQFYISDWLDGEFLGGTMSGARWFNGTWRYGSAMNIYWENGTWKNGNWDGSPFDLTTLSFTQSRQDVVPGPERDMLLRVANVHRHGNVHIINAFTGSFSDNKFAGWTHSQTDPALTQWEPELGTSYYFLDNISPTVPRIERTGFVFNTFTQSLNNVSVSEMRVLGDLYPTDEYRVLMYGGFISVTASSTDTRETLAGKLVDEVNRGRTVPVVKYDQWTANGYVTRYFTWLQLIGVAWQILDPITLLPLDPADIAALFSQIPLAQNLTDGNFTVVTTNDTYVEGQAISGFVTSSAYRQSERLYAQVNAGGLTASVFTQSGLLYNVSLDVTSVGGRTDFVVQISDKSFRESITSGQQTLNYSLVTDASLQDVDYNLYVERVTYQNPDNSTFYVRGMTINVLEAQYDTEYNNRLYSAATYSLPFRYGPTGSSMSLPGRLLAGIAVNSDAVSIKYGNGAFKYGIWESGYWNNGWHASWDNQPEYYLFTDLLQGGFVEVSQNFWAVKLSALTNTDGIGIGDRVSIGNLVFIDVNENRRLVTKPYRVVNKTATTITAEVSVNFSVRRIERDSKLHLIYVSKNVWQSGIFHNGFFRGVWNYGLFRGYPYITHMERTQWIDGIFDGGTFRSAKGYYRDLGLTQSYNDGLVQNFLFRDNNVGPVGGYKYNSWVDTNFYTYSMTNLFRDNLSYDSTWGVVKSTGNLKGYPSEDVLSSRSIFRNSFDLATGNYSLGSKGREFVDFLGRSALFTYPANSSGVPGVAEFLANGWTYSIRSLDFHSNAKGIAGQGAPPDYGVLQVNYQTEAFTNTGAKFVQTSKVRYLNNNFHVVGVPPTLVPSANNSVQGDFSSNPAGSPGYSVFEDGSALAGVKFSNHSYPYTSWPHRVNFPMSVSSLSVYVNNGNAPTPLSAGYLQVDGPHTISANRRVYMFDRFNPTSTDAQYGGYHRPSPANNFSFQVNNPVTSNVAGSNWTYMKFQVLKNTRLRMNAEIPFKFFAAEGPSGGGIGQRDGWSIFRIVGVVEKYPVATGAPEPTEADWRYVTHTQLNFYPQSKASTIDGSLRGYAIDKVSGTIAYDDMLSSTNNFFVGYLSINGFEQDFAAGDLIRFRLYWMDMRKSFASLNDNYTTGTFPFTKREQVGAPGYMDLIIGKDDTMPYTQNNHGYWEVIDTSTYVNQNTNILNNTKTEAIERGRYSVIDFDIESSVGSKYQGTSSVGTDLLPNIFLLNSEYEGLPGGFNDVVNHGLTTGNKKEYFYNRKSMSMFFKAVETFSVQFSKIKFYETDMIPFFRYTDQASVNRDPQSPYYGKAPETALPDSSLSLDTISYTSPFGGNIPIRSSLISSGGGGVGPTGPGGDTGGGGGGILPPPPPTVSVSYTFFTDTEYVNNYSTYTIVVKDNTNTTVRTVTQTLTQALNSVSGNIRVNLGHTLVLSIETTILSIEEPFFSGVNLSVSDGLNSAYNSVIYSFPQSTGSVTMTTVPVTADTLLYLDVVKI